MNVCRLYIVDTSLISDEYIITLFLYTIYSFIILHTFQSRHSKKNQHFLNHDTMTVLSNSTLANFLKILLIFIQIKWYWDNVIRYIKLVSLGKYHRNKMKHNRKRKINEHRYLFDIIYHWITLTNNEWLIYYQIYGNAWWDY